MLSPDDLPPPSREPFSPNYDPLIERIRLWAESAEQLHAALIIGSRARTDHPADEWSDLDVILFVDQPEALIQGAGWLAQIDTPLLTFVEPTPDGGWERRALFPGGLDVDFALVPAAFLEQMRPDNLSPFVADLVQRGVRPLVDKDGHLARLLSRELPGVPPYQPPSQTEFLNVVHDFWYHTLWSTKHLRRGELWWAIGCINGYLTTLLRQMLEWHARAVQGPGHDTWMRGRFLEEWADPQTVAELPHIFTRYDALEMSHALRTTMKLFKRVSLEAAERLGYAYPLEGMQAAEELVDRLLPYK